MKKTIIITGTSSGLGLSLSVQLAKAGHSVYATMRNLDKKEALEKAAVKENVTLNIKKLDIQSTSSVNNCIGEIVKAEGKIDCLINNAGVGFIKTTEQASEEEIKEVMDVNFMGMVRCVKSVLPFMREMKSGHIINVTSVGGLVGQPFNEFYCAAKFAVEGYTESMASYIPAHFNISFTAVEPGGIQSEFANTILENIQKSGGMVNDEYQPLLQKYIDSPRTDDCYQSSDEVASVIVKCIDSEHPPVRMRTSNWANKFCDMKTKSDPDGTLLQKEIVKQFF